MIANFFVAEMGLPGWMDKVEKMKKTQLDLLIKNANKAIVSSHLTLDGLKSNKVLQRKNIIRADEGTIQSPDQPNACAASA